MDGKEGKQYDVIGAGSLIFSPDSKRLAYVAAAGKKQFVVVDGKQGKQYDEIGRIIFDSPDSLHYIARKYLKGSGIYYLVKKRIK